MIQDTLLQRKKGRAIYIFAIYEWNVAHAMERLRPEFVGRRNKVQVLRSGHFDVKGFSAPRVD
jgi:hypothetical protein